jgi:hypothetical protein
LKARLDKVLGLTGAVAIKSKAEDVLATSRMEEDVPFDATSKSGGDDDLDYFKSLAETN